MQSYTEIPGSKPVKDSRTLILNNDKTIASHYAGTAFPTANLIVGMECYRTDLGLKYRLTSTSPVNWEPVLKAAEIAKVKVSNAARADTAANAETAANANKLIGKNWYWSGQGGQPAWVWGGSDGTNMYVYNPSNFRVANANTVADLLVHGGRNKEANKIVRTNASGYLDIGYLNSDIGVENGNVTNVIYDNGDGYFRKCSFAHFTSKINVIGGTTAQKLLQDYTVPSDCAKFTLSGIDLSKGPTKVIWESPRLNYNGNGYWGIFMMPGELGITGVANKGRSFIGTHGLGKAGQYGAIPLGCSANTCVSGTTFPVECCYSYFEIEMRYILGKYVLAKVEGMDWYWGSTSTYWISKNTVNSVKSIIIYSTTANNVGEGSSAYLQTGIKSGTRIKIYQ